MNAVREAIREYEAGNWEAAHLRVQDDASDLASYLHGVLHREEGDTANARYWFRRSGSIPDRLGVDPVRITELKESGSDCTEELADEWAAIKNFLERSRA
jgi:hypothetical protein